MNHTLTSSAALLIGLAALSNKPAVDEVDLSLRFKKGQTFSVTSSSEVDMALDELAVMVDGAEVLGDGIGFEMLAEMAEASTTEILEVKDGSVTAMRITYDEQGGQMEGSFDAMGEADSMNESLDSDLEGHTIEVRLDEDGELVVTDVSEDVDETLSEEQLAMFDLEPMAAKLLPEGPVEIGEEFELASEWMELAAEFMEEDLGEAMDDLGDEEAAAAEVVMESFYEALSIEATGKVTGVEDGMATIEYVMSAAVEMDDLMSLAAEVSPEAGEIPPGVEASMLMGLEISGTGMFDLELGQLVSLELEGDMSMEMDGAADMQGTSAEASAAMSGTLTLKMAVEIE
jgi:hypothetical protein